MNRAEIIDQIHKKSSLLCVGLDADINKIPPFLLELEDPIFEFNKQIIDATKDYCIAYKPNIAFYEALGPKGWISLQKTIDYIPNEIFTIADAKRGDIGNTSLMYADTFFKTYNFDAVTLAPYMGEDSLTPFLNYENKWSIVLALTSNESGGDFQKLQLDNGEMLFENIIKNISRLGTSDNTMFVVGATRAADIKKVRTLVPNHFLLVPGVGEQGGDLQQVINNGRNEDIGLIINSSRSIIYSGNDEDFASKAADAAKLIQLEMSNFL